jgi:hypothetical protein
MSEADGAMPPRAVCRDMSDTLPPLSLAAWRDFSRISLYKIKIVSTGSMEDQEVH